MPDFLDLLARDARATIAKRYYEYPSEGTAASVGLRKTILRSKRVPVITEIKGASPSRGVIRKSFEAAGTALAMARGGAVGISVLTEPEHFNGSLSNLDKVRRAVKLPILMKDIIISSVQLDAASRIGADAVLLIQTLHDRGYSELDLTDMIKEAHSRSLEVLLEVHDEDEFQRALKSEADLVGINNRNLGTLEVDLNVTKKILAGNRVDDKIVVSESGILTASNVRFLNSCGAMAFLIGSAIMSADNVETKVREFVHALRKKKVKE